MRAHYIIIVLELILVSAQACFQPWENNRKPISVRRIKFVHGLQCPRFLTSHTVVYLHTSVCPRGDDSLSN